MELLSPEQEEGRLLEIRKQWYRLPFIKYAIVQSCKQKELCLLTKYPKIDYYKNYPRSVIRYLQCGHSMYLDKHFQAFGFMKKPFMNLYSSLAYLDYLPVFSYNLQNRKYGEEYKQYAEEYMKHVVGYDILFDMDNEEIMEAWEDSKILKDILDNAKVAYSVTFSGTKGFHFRIPYEFTGNEETDFGKFINSIASFIYNIKVIYSIASIDDSITDNKRVVKIPYSLDKDKVVLPLSDEQFNNFNIDMVKFYNVIKNVKLMNRGSLVRDHGLSKGFLQSNFQKFLKEHL